MTKCIDCQKEISRNSLRCKSCFNKFKWKTDDNFGMKGKKMPKITKEKWSKKRKGKGNSFFGKHHTKELKQRFHEERKGKSFSPETQFKKGQTKGDKNVNWKGGISFIPYPPEFNIRLKKLIRDRDKYKCFICDKNGFQVHHINYDKQNCNPENLITLCKSCHHKTNTKRKEWIKYFEEALKCS